MAEPSEFVSVPVGDLTVGAVSAELGQKVTAGQVLATLTGGPVVLSADITTAQAANLTGDPKFEIAGEPSSKCTLGKAFLWRTLMFSRSVVCGFGVWPN